MNRGPDRRGPFQGPPSARIFGSKMVPTGTKRYQLVPVSGVDIDKSYQVDKISNQPNGPKSHPYHPQTVGHECFNYCKVFGGSDGLRFECVGVKHTFSG